MTEHPSPVTDTRPSEANKHPVPQTVPAGILTSIDSLGTPATVDGLQSPTDRYELDVAHNDHVKFTDVRCNG